MPNKMSMNVQSGHSSGAVSRLPKAAPAAPVAEPVGDSGHGEVNEVAVGDINAVTASRTPFILDLEQGSMPAGILTKGNAERFVSLQLNQAQVDEGQTWDFTLLEGTDVKLIWPLMLANSSI